MESQNPVSANEHTIALQKLLNQKRFDPQTAIQHVKDGADPNTKDDNGDSLLHHLVHGFSGDSSHIIELLKMDNTNALIKNKNGKTAFECLIDGDYGKTIKKGEQELILSIVSTLTSRVKKFIANDNNDAAIGCMEILVKLSPTPKEYCNLAVAYLNKNYYEKAREANDAAFALDNDFFHVHVNRGCFDFDEKQYDSAIIHLEKALSYQDTETRGYAAIVCYTLGSSYYHTNNYLKSIQSSLMIFKFNPSDYYSIKTYFVIGNAFMKNGDLQSAIENYTKSLIIDKKNDFRYWMNNEKYSLSEFFDLDLSSLSQDLLLDFIGSFPDRKQLELLSQCKNTDTQLAKRMSVSDFSLNLFAPKIMDRIDTMIENLITRISTNVTHTSIIKPITADEIPWHSGGDVQLNLITRKKF